MRICIITPELPPYNPVGGIGRHVLTLAGGYAHRGHDVTVAGFGIHPSPVVTHDWGQSLCLSFPGSKPGTLDPARVRGALAVRSFLASSKGRFDIVEVSNWPGHAAFIPANDVKYVVRLSSPWAECDPVPILKPLYSWLETRTCRRAKLLIANTEIMRRKAPEYYRCSLVPTAVVHYGLPDVSPSGLDPPHNRIAMLYIGRAERRKGTDNLIRALGAVMPRHSRLHVTLIGCDVEAYAGGDRELSVLWRGLRERCGDRISTPGRVEEAEKRRLIESSHWVVVPSRFESFGQVAIEAMRGGTPVIAAAAGGLAEVCSQGAGSLVYGPPGDAGALSETIDAVCRNGEAYALSLRPACRETYLAHFTADRFVDQSLECYRRVLLGR